MGWLKVRIKINYAPSFSPLIDLWPKQLSLNQRTITRVGYFQMDVDLEKQEIDAFKERRVKRQTIRKVDYHQRGT